ncbi:MAG: FecR domain-containing protein [Prolixibacteraceae bacterium]
MEEEKKIEEKFVSYLVGESDSNSASTDAEKKSLEELEQTWILTGTAHSFRNSDTDKAWSKLSDEIRVEPKIIPVKRFNFLRYAAIFVALVALTASTFMLTQKSPVITNPLVASASEMKIVQTGSNPAEPTNVVLPDGSIVKMNAGSKLEYPSQFSGENRKVKLTGEAYFEVIHDATHPFVVELYNVEVEDLGTSFNISAYPGKEKIEVNVTSGSVRLRELNIKKEAVLAAGWNAKCFKGNGSIEVFKELSPNYLSWLTKEVTFHHTPLSTVFESLENIYHVKIEYSNPEIAAIPYTANFEKFELGDIVNVIAKTHHLKVTKEADRIVFALK